MISFITGGGCWDYWYSDWKNMFSY